MGNRCKAAGLAAGPIIAILIAAPISAIAQAPPDQLPSLQPDSQPAPAKPAPKPKPRTRAQQAPRPTSEVQPDLDAGDQLAPSQMQQPMPAQAPMPGKPPKRAAAPATPAPATPAAEGGDSKPAPAASNKPAPAASSKPGPGARAIACSGAFARDSSHLKIAVAFDSKNISYTDVDSGVGGKVQATVIYPSDPKRRLEVWWNNPASRSDTYLIIVNGQSNWAGPKGVHLGLGLQALEKLNKKPFKLKGFSKDNVASVSDWQGGALATLPGGCKVGVNLAVDAKAAAEVRSAVTGDKEFDSSDAAMRAAKPTVHEIIIGY